MATDTTSAGPEASSIEFTAYFEDVPDPRIQRRKEHTLLDITGLTICAVVAGADTFAGDTFAGIERFGKSRRGWLKQFLELKNGIPSHDTLGRVYSRQGILSAGYGARWIRRSLRMDFAGGSEG